MSTDAESLSVLEGLLTEFYASGTDNTRKKDIEAILSHFSQQQTAWKHCLYFISNTSNEYALMYSMNVLETTINQQWTCLTTDNKLLIRSTINHLLSIGHARVATFVRNKMVKLVIAIGRHDWPHAYPDFMSHILSLLQHDDTQVLGLVLLQTASEELTSPREDLVAARKEELLSLLHQNATPMFTAITDILESVLKRKKIMNCIATPPSSPALNSRSNRHIPLTSTPISVNNRTQSVMSPGQLLHDSAALHTVFDSHSLLVCHHALQCLSHLFTWIPLSSTVTPEIIKVIFHYASLGIHENDDDGGQDDRTHLAEIAMSCINELLMKNCVPKEFEDFLLNMFTQTYSLLHTLTSNCRIQMLNEAYVEKFTEFLRLFTSYHLRRFEENPQFPMLEFLSLLFTYTFKQVTNEGFFTCLSIWSDFLDYLVDKLESKTTSDKATALTKYQEAILALSSEVTRKFQFRFNQSHLEELDDDVLDDDCKTEWQYFLGECLEMIAKISHLFPSQIFTVVRETFSENVTVYLGLEAYVRCDPVSGSMTSKRQLSVTAENDLRRLHCTLRDLSSLLQAQGRLAEHFLGKQFEPAFEDAFVLVEKLVHTATYGTKLKLYETSSSIQSVLETDFIETHAQSIAAVKAYCGWLAVCYEYTRTERPSEQGRCDRLISAIVDAIVPLFLENTVPEKVLLAASHLMLSLCTTVRSEKLCNLPLVQQLYQRGVCVTNAPPEVEILIFRSLSHHLVVPWLGVPTSDADQDWTNRAQLLSTYVNRVLQNFRTLKDLTALSTDQSVQDGVRQCVEKSVQLLTDCIDHLEDGGNSRSKQMIYTALQDYIQLCLNLLPIYISHIEVTHQMLVLFVALVRALRVQMGVQLTQHIVQSIMNVFTRELIVESLQTDNTSGHMLIEKFLKILQVIVQEPGATFKTFLPSILDLCLNQLFPVLAERASPDVKPALYELMTQLLHHNWRYFFKASILHSMNGHTGERMEHEQQFNTIMQAYGQSFLQPDIAVFKQNLDALDYLNETQRLYSKDIFRETMLPQFITVLLQVLVHRSHDLLRDEIAIGLYKMAAVDMDLFYTRLIPHFLSVSENLDDDQKGRLMAVFHAEKDLPSFTQNIHRFINDLRYYRLCNNSLPDGAVKL